MSFTVTFRPEADLDLAEAQAYLDRQESGLGREFADEIETCLLGVSRLPESFPVVSRRTRRALVKRFPYAIFFFIDGDRIRVTAIVHQSRHPRTWRRRP